jgi:hypothetical protein
LEEDESDENLMTNEFAQDPKFEHKYDILYDSLSDFINEFPKFSTYFNYIREKYDSASNEQSQFEAVKLENFRQNMSKMRSQLDSEYMQRNKLSQKLQDYEGKTLQYNLFFRKNFNS